MWAEKGSDWGCCEGRAVIGSEAGVTGVERQQVVENRSANERSWEEGGMEQAVFLIYVRNVCMTTRWKLME